MNKSILIQSLLAVVLSASVATAQEKWVATSEDGMMRADSPDVIPLGRGGLWHRDIPVGYIVIEGDIQIRFDQFETMMAGDGTFISSGYWPSQTVPYDFVTTGTGAVGTFEQQDAIDAMNTIMQRVGINFRPATGGEDRIRFQSSSFNNSPVGHQGGTQTINISSWFSQIVICHEIYHSLGFWHEQSRSDRNGYVTIQTDNICGSAISTACTAGTGAGQCCGCVNSGGSCVSCAFNFNIQSGSLNYGSYDFDSFMHYGPSSFSCNGQNTITVNPPFNATIGQRNHFSYWDTVVARGLYPFADDRWWDQGAGSNGSGSLRSPRNGSFASAYNATPAGGTLFIKPTGGSFSAVGLYTKAMTIRAPMGATLGN